MRALSRLFKAHNYEGAEILRSLTARPCPTLASNLYEPFERGLRALITSPFRTLRQDFRRSLSTSSDKESFSSKSPQSNLSINSHVLGKSKKVLFIASIWPEKAMSASGVRTVGLIRSLKRRDHQVHFLSPGRETPSTAMLRSEMGVHTHSCPLNDEEAFLAILDTIKPDVVICDRFITEEQFGWKIRKASSETAIVIDSQDFHSLRIHRQALHSKGASLAEICTSIPPLELPILRRELASFHRADHVLLVSDFERALLATHYAFPPSKLSLAPFFYEKFHSNLECLSDRERAYQFDSRKNFFMIGNFRHPPNHDAVAWMRTIWPRIRERIPSAELHVYGVFADQASMELDDQTIGFRVKGSIPDGALYRKLSKYRVNLAPLRFGAGIKGKIADAWLAGTPTVTTPIGSEGMEFFETTSKNDDDLSKGVRLAMTYSSPRIASSESRDVSRPLDWGGLISTNEDDLVRHAISLYQDRELWIEATLRGQEIMRKKFWENPNSELFVDEIETISNTLAQRRSVDVVGSILRDEHHRSTEYFGRFIEIKEQINRLRTQAKHDQKQS